jgi:hypothetical protein
MPKKANPAPQAKAWGGKALGAEDRVEAGGGLYPTPKGIVDNYNALIDRAKERAWHKDPAFFIHVDAYTKKVGTLEGAIVPFSPKQTLGEALANLREKVDRVRVNNSQRKPERPLMAAIDALRAFDREGEGEEEAAPAGAPPPEEAHRPAAAAAVAALNPVVTEAETLVIAGMLDVTLGLFKDNQSALIKAVSLPPPEVASMQELAARLAALGKDEARKALAKATAAKLPPRMMRGGGAGRQEDSEEAEEGGGAGERKGQTALLKVVKAAMAVRSALVKDLSEDQQVQLDTLTNAVQAFTEQYASDAEILPASTMKVNSLDNLGPILPRGVLRRYPAGTGAAIMLYDADLLKVSESSEAHSAISTWVAEGDILADLTGLLLVDAVREVVFELWKGGLTPFITIQAWGELMDPSAGSPAAKAARRLPADAGAALGFSHNLTIKVAALEAKARGSMTLGGGGVDRQGAHALLARLILKEMTDLASDAACYSGFGQLRSAHARPRKGAITAAPYTFVLWKLLCMLAAGVAVLKFSERAGAALSGAGVITYAQSSVGPVNVLGEPLAGGKRRKNQEGKDSKAQRKKNRKTHGAEAAGGTSGASAASSSEEEEGPVTATQPSSAVAARAGFPLWHFLKKRFKGVAKYVRRDVEFACCFCGSVDCVYGDRCPAGFPKAELQAQRGQYDPQFQSRDSLIKLYRDMKSEHRRE